MLFGEPDEVEQKPEAPQPITVCEAPLTAYAPCTGDLIAMADLPDPVFAAGVMGQAVGISPREGVVYAPVSGTVTLLTHTLHAVGLESDDGLQILIHVGVDTVNLRGEGFHGFVQQGQRVRAGEPLLVMDLALIAEAGYSDVVITAVSNTDEFVSVVAPGPGIVAAGEQVLVACR